MRITAEEKLMYDVMKAIYESGIPISFKGSMVLKACLHEAGYTGDTVPLAAVSCGITAILSIKAFVSSAAPITRRTREALAQTDIISERMLSNKWC